MLLSTFCIKCSKTENYLQEIWDFVVWLMNAIRFCQLFLNSWHLLSSIWVRFALFIFHSWMLILRPSWLDYILIFFGNVLQYKLIKIDNMTIINQWRGIVGKLNRRDWTGSWVKWQDSIAVSVFVLFWLSLTNPNSNLMLSQVTSKSGFSKSCS